jgi:hypothetical protein
MFEFLNKNNSEIENQIYTLIENGVDLNKFKEYYEKYQNYIMLIEKTTKLYPFTEGTKLYVINAGQGALGTNGCTGIVVKEKSQKCHSAKYINYEYRDIITQ